MRTVTKYGQTLAIVLSPSDYMQHSKKVFFTDTRDLLQVGSLFFPGGSKVAPHRHRVKENDEAPMEVILVLCGHGVVSVYDTDGAFAECFEVRTGDIVIQKRGGHGFEWTADTAILEVKTGPYLGQDSDKEPIEEKKGG
jgi:hypothetical protein